MSHHDDHHSEEKKPVAFTVPFILGLVTITAILSLVSLGNPCHCKESCETECCTPGAEKHADAHGTEHGENHATEAEHGGH
ncbi:MAG: hypothetical protein IPM51_05345 [Sphingobacteriaceae bacterium]|nr:hypothetical protein [Sphingobacteriaceae bacterium]